MEKLAICPTSPEKIPELLRQVAAHGKNHLVDDPYARLKLLEAVRNLAYAVETPREAMIRHCWSEVRMHHGAANTTWADSPTASPQAMPRWKPASSSAYSRPSPRMIRRRRSRTLQIQLARMPRCSVSAQHGISIGIPGLTSRPAYETSHRDCSNRRDRPWGVLPKWILHCLDCREIQ